MLYEARRLAETDFRSFVQEARLAGLKEAREEGARTGLENGLERGRAEVLKLGLVEQVRLRQALLREPSSAEAELLRMDLESLSRLCDELERRLPLPGQSIASRRHDVFKFVLIAAQAARGSLKKDYVILLASHPCNDAIL